jgi:hypothetical protein
MKKHFEEINKVCIENSRISTKVVDNFLLNFVAKREGSDKLMDQFTVKYLHILRKMPQEFFPRVMAEYIVGKIFMQNGFIHKYLNHSTIKALDEESTRFLLYQSEHPWRYCFARIIDHPEKEFFMFYDEFLDEEFLLYSRGVEAYVESDHKSSLYFMLIGFNGKCWQSYGVILPFRSFSTDDIYFYGTEIFPEVESDETLMESVYKNPIPYFMLSVGMEYPITISQNHLLRYFTASDQVMKIDTEKLRKVFSIQWNKNVYKLMDEKLHSHPHFAKAYFNEKTGELERHAMTEFGFNELSRMLIENGIKVKEEEDFSVSLTMMATMKEILKRTIVLDKYEKDFPEINENEMDDENLKKINLYLKALLPYINSGQKPDIQKLADQFDIDLRNAQGIYDSVKKKPFKTN